MRLLMVILVLLAAGSAHAQDEDESLVAVYTDIPYYTGDDADPIHHIVDIYAPADAMDYPVVIYAHGGAWVSGSKVHYDNIGYTLAQAGIGAVIINYRLSPEVTHPAHIADLARAFAWTAASIPDYGGDPARIVISGHSAGGHMASLLALDPQYLQAVDHSAADIRGVLVFSGVFRIDDWIMQWAHGAFPDDDAGREAASPLAHAPAASEDSPPFLLLVAERDYPELIAQTEAMFAALNEAGATADMAVVEDRAHFTLVTRIGSEGDETAPLILDWLAQVLAPDDPQDD